MRNELMRLLVVMMFITAGIECVQSAPLTYQGRLQEGGKAVSGTYDFQFRLAKTENGYVGPGVFLEGVTVTNGLFTVLLDFGTSVFDGSNLWLEIGVRTS